MGSDPSKQKREKNEVSHILSQHPNSWYVGCNPALASFSTCLFVSFAFLTSTPAQTPFNCRAQHSYFCLLESLQQVTFSCCFLSNKQLLKEKQSSFPKFGILDLVSSYNLSEIFKWSMSATGRAAVQWSFSFLLESEVTKFKLSPNLYIFIQEATGNPMPGF